MIVVTEQKQSPILLCMLRKIVVNVAGYIYQYQLRSAGPIISDYLLLMYPGYPLGNTVRIYVPSGVQ